MSFDKGLELAVNRRIQDASLTTFPSATGGEDLGINGTYTSTSKGILLSGNLETSSDITFQMVSLWFRFNNIISQFSLFDSVDASASFTANTVVANARSSNLGTSEHQSGWCYGTMNQTRYDKTTDFMMHMQGTSVAESPSDGSISRRLRSVAWNTVLDFDYRGSANQYCAVAIDGGVSTSILGVRVNHPPTWSGTAKCVRYRESDDRFVIMVEGTSDQVYTLDGDTGTLTSIYSNAVNIAPRALALFGDSQLYFTASDSHIYTLDLSSSANVPAQVTTTTVGTTKNLNYYKGKLYVWGSSNTLQEIHVATGQVFSVPNIPSQFSIYAFDFEGGYIFHPKSNDFYTRVTYDFTGSDGTSYTMTEGTNTISSTYINGKSVTSLEDMIQYSYGGLNNVVFTLTSPTTSILTLFGSSSGTDSADVTVDAVYVYSESLPGTEVLYLYETSLGNMSAVPKRPNLVSDGAVLYVNAAITESYTSGSGTLNDLTGTSVTLNSNLGSTTVTEGALDFTSKTDYLTPSEAVKVQTISMWIKKTSKGSNLLDFRSDYANAYTYFHIMSGDWFSNATVYIDGVQSPWTDWFNPNTTSTFRNLVFVGSTVATTTFKLFLDDGNLFQSLLVYDRALSVEEVLQNYEVILAIPDIMIELPPFTVTPRVVSVGVAVRPVDGATGYRLTSQKTGSPRETVVKNYFTDLDQTVRDLTPDTTYTLRLYSTTGSGFDLAGESTTSTLANSASNYDVNEFGGAGKFDLSALNSTSVALMSNFMNDLFTTGDEIDISVSGARGTKKSKFVNRGGSVSITDSEALVAPFSTDAGPGQAVTLTLSDASSVAVSYDENTEAVTVGATSYTLGESFVLDGKKTTIVDI